MSDRYPSLGFRLEERDGEATGIWEGWVQPIRTTAGLNSIIYDLDQDRPVLIDHDSATIGHYQECGQAHKTHRIFRNLKRPDRRFRLRIEFGGGPSHPKAYLLDPVVTPQTRYHIFGKNRICAYAPFTGVWRANDHTVADFTDHVLIWLFKWNAWVEIGHWLGAEMDHRPMYLLSTVRPEMECWCGSGKLYEACCRPLDQYKANGEAQEMLLRRSPLFQKAKIDYTALKALATFLFPIKRLR